MSAPVRDNDIVHFAELIDRPSSVQGLVDCDYLAMSVETHTLTHDRLPNSKNIARVVIVNEDGERVLDTLVAPQTKDVAVKGGHRQAVFKFAEAKAETFETVREKVVQLIQGKKLVAYHLGMKCSDLLLTPADIGGAEGHMDVAKIFNTSAD